jgi:hypothetical protein
MLGIPMDLILEEILVWITPIRCLKIPFWMLEPTKRKVPDLDKVLLLLGLEI